MINARKFRRIHFSRRQLPTDQNFCRASFYCYFRVGGEIIPVPIAFLLFQIFWRRKYFLQHHFCQSGKPATFLFCCFKININKSLGQYQIFQTKTTLLLSCGLFCPTSEMSFLCSLIMQVFHFNNQVIKSVVVPLLPAWCHSFNQKQHVCLMRRISGWILTINFCTLHKNYLKFRQIQFTI